jgi:hypothetical protein
MMNTKNASGGEPSTVPLALLLPSMANRTPMLVTSKATTSPNRSAFPARNPLRRAAITPEMAVSAHETFMKHPWVNALWSKRGPGPEKLAHMEAILRVLREGGFSVDQACRGYHAVTMHTLGFTLQALDFPIDSTNMKAAATAFLESADTEAIPYVVEHVQPISTIRNPAMSLSSCSI